VRQCESLGKVDAAAVGDPARDIAVVGLAYCWAIVVSGVGFGLLALVLAR